MKLNHLLVLGLVTAAATACAKTGQTQKATTNVPEWYMVPPAGCGVGSQLMQPGMLEASKLGAETAARNSLAGQLQTKIESMVKSYTDQGMAEGQAFGESETRSAVRNITDQSLVGARTVQMEPTNTDMFVLVCLDPETFGDMFSKMDSMSNQMRTALRKRMDAEFEDLDKELEKLRSR